jgi:excisionase family DNA binding protein
MKSRGRTIESPTSSPRRRGGVRGTRAASGSPPSGAATPDWTVSAADLDSRPGVQDEPLLLGAAEVARLLGIGRTKVYELIARRQLPVVCIGRCVRVPRHQLQGWIVSHTHVSGGH